jgi:hypothetical protein
MIMQSKEIRTPIKGSIRSKNSCLNPIEKGKGVVSEPNNGFFEKSPSNMGDSDFIDQDRNADYDLYREV